MLDTPSKIEKQYHQMIMALSPARRFQMAGQMFSTAKKLVMAGILMQNPKQTKAELRTRLFLRFYRTDFSLPELKKIIAHMPDMDLKVWDEIVEKNY